MKWKIEDIGVHTNILMDDGQSDMDSDPVAIGLPLALAERLVKLHNDDLEKCEKILKDAKGCINGTNAISDTDFIDDYFKKIAKGEGNV